MTEEQLLAQATLDHFKWFHPARLFTQEKPGCTKEHIQFILQQIIDGAVTDAKAHRFIGWAQGIMCVEGFMTLDDAKIINRNVING